MIGAARGKQKCTPAYKLDGDSGRQIYFPCRWRRAHAAFPKEVASWDWIIRAEQIPRPCTECLGRMNQKDMVNRYLALTESPNCTCPLGSKVTGSGGYCELHKIGWYDSKAPRITVEAIQNELRSEKADNQQGQ